MPAGRPKGYPKTGGRQKGSLNKTTKAFRESVLNTFGTIGGDEAFANWARENQTEFYKLCGKLIPQEVAAAPGTAVTLTITGV